MTNNNLEVAKRFYNEVVNKGDSLVMKSIMSDNFIDHYASPTLPKGLEGFRVFIHMIATAFPDIHATVEDLFSDGNMITARLTIEGTHTGVLLGNIQPTGKRAVWTGIDILKIEDGIITERWSQRDLLGMMRQLGVVK